MRKGEFMIITVTSYKGGVGKTTTAIHLAAYLQRLAPTLLVDGDASRSATKWSQRGDDKGLPFKVVTHAQMVSHIRDYKHIIIDTEGNPSDDDFKDLAGNCDLLVIPAVPESVATDGLTHTLSKLHHLGNKKHTQASDRWAAAAQHAGCPGHPRLCYGNSEARRIRESRCRRGAGLRRQGRPQRHACLG
jgi:cellulose biosynthesis protein BcsQ